MFLSGTTWDTDSGQHAKGNFLLVFQQSWDLGKEPSPRELRCLVRNVRMDQLGNFMAGHAEVKLPEEADKLRISLSGPFGNDGLPLEVTKLEQGLGKIPSRLWDMLTPMPSELSERYWCSNREDSTEAEAHKSIKSWARKNLAMLRRLRVVAAKVTASS